MRFKCCRLYAPRIYKSKSKYKGQSQGKWKSNKQTNVKFDHIKHCPYTLIDRKVLLCPHIPMFKHKKDVLSGGIKKGCFRGTECILTDAFRL